MTPERCRGVCEYDDDPHYHVDLDRLRAVEPRSFAADVARGELRLWWESLTYEDKWEAFLIEKSNADALGDRAAEEGR